MVILVRLTLVKLDLGFTEWDQIELCAPMTIDQVINYFKQKYGVIILIISAEDTIIYNSFVNNPPNK